MDVTRIRRAVVYFYDFFLILLVSRLLSYINTDHNSSARETVAKTTVISWRGMLSKLLLAVYDVESSNAGGRGRKADGWELNGMVLDVSTTPFNPLSLYTGFLPHKSTFAPLRTTFNPYASLDEAQ